LWLDSTRKCAAVLVEHVEKGTGGGTGEFVIGLGNRDNEQPGGKQALFGGEVIVAGSSLHASKVGFVSCDKMPLCFTSLLACEL